MNNDPFLDVSRRSYRLADLARHQPVDTIAEDAAMIERLRQERGEHFTLLFDDGNIDAHGGDESSADWALVHEFLRPCGPDPERIERSCKKSALYRRPGRAEKWDTKHFSNGRTYIRGTIENAIASQSAESKEELDSVGQATGFKSWRELLETPEVTTEWLVGGLFPSGGSSLWVAKPKVGKSTCVQNLAHAVSCGREFLGRTTAAGPVLYLALEEKESEVRKHFEAMGTPEDAPIYFYFARTPDDGLSWLRTAIEHYKPRLVIVDTFQKFTRVRDIKDYAIVTNKMDPIMALARESGAHVAFTHHGTKAQCADPGDAALGSTALFGGVDTLVYLHKTQDYRTIGSIQRYGDDLPETILSLDAATWTVSLDGLKKAADRKAGAQAILAFLAERELVDEPTIREQVGGRTQDLAAALRDLVKSGKAVRSGGGKKGDPYLYGPYYPLVPAHIREQESDFRENGKANEIEPDACFP